MQSSFIKKFLEEKRRKRIALAVFVLLCLAVVPLASLLSLRPASAATETTFNYQIISPYSSVSWPSWGKYKAGLHVHSTNSSSDGSAVTLLNQMIEKHYAEGYDILAITEHDVLTNSWINPPTSNGLLQSRYDTINTGADRNDRPMRMVPNTIEQSLYHHVNTYFTDYTNTGTKRTSGTVAEYLDDARPALDAAQAQGGLSILNHPGRYTGGQVVGPAGAAASSHPATVKKYADIFMEYPSCVGMEIINKKDGESVNDRILWDKILMETIPQGRNVWGFANDDAHDEKDVGYSYNMFVMYNNTIETNFKTAMQNGSFYAVAKYAWNELETTFTPSGPAPEITSVSTSVTGITIGVSNCTKIRWIADGGEVVTDESFPNAATTKSIDLTQFPQVNTYIRAEVSGPGGIAFTQPFMVIKKPNFTQKAEWVWTGSEPTHLKFTIETAVPPSYVPYPTDPTNKTFMLAEQLGILLADSYNVLSVSSTKNKIRNFSVVMDPPPSGPEPPFQWFVSTANGANILRNQNSTGDCELPGNWTLYLGDGTGNYNENSIWKYNTVKKITLSYEVAMDTVADTTIASTDKLRGMTFRDIFSGDGISDLSKSETLIQTLSSYCRAGYYRNSTFVQSHSSMKAGNFPIKTSMPKPIGNNVFEYEVYLGWFDGNLDARNVPFRADGLAALFEDEFDPRLEYVPKSMRMEAYPINNMYPVGSHGLFGPYTTSSGIAVPVSDAAVTETLTVTDNKISMDLMDMKMLGGTSTAPAITGSAVRATAGDASKQIVIRYQLRVKPEYVSDPFHGDVLNTASIIPTNPDVKGINYPGRWRATSNAHKLLYTGEPISVFITGQKDVKGENAPNNTAFTFSISQVNENGTPYTGGNALEKMPAPVQVKTTKPGEEVYDFTFGEITGLKPNCTYYFKVSESDGGLSGWEYAAPQQITVVVDGQGKVFVSAGSDKPFALTPNEIVKHAPYSGSMYSIPPDYPFAYLSKEAEYIPESSNAFNIVLTAEGARVELVPVPAFTVMSLDVTTSMRFTMHDGTDAPFAEARIAELVKAAKEFIRGYFHDDETNSWNTMNYLSIVLYRGYWAEFRVGLTNTINKGEALGWVTVNNQGVLIDENGEPIPRAWMEPINQKSENMTVDDLCDLIEILNNNAVRDMGSWPSDHNPALGLNGWNNGEPGLGMNNQANADGPRGRFKDRPDRHGYGTSGARASVRRDGTSTQAGIYGAIKMLDITKSLDIPGLLPHNYYSYNAVIMTDGRSNLGYATTPTPHATTWAQAVAFPAGQDRSRGVGTPDDLAGGKQFTINAGNILKAGSVDGVVKPTVYSVIFAEQGQEAIDSMQTIASPVPNTPSDKLYFRAGFLVEGEFVFDVIRKSIQNSARTTIPTIEADSVITDIIPGDFVLKSVSTEIPNPQTPYNPLQLTTFPGSITGDGGSLNISKNGNDDWVVEWTIPQVLQHGNRAQLAIEVEVPPTCSGGEQLYMGDDADKYLGHWLRNTNRGATFEYKNMIGPSGWTADYPVPRVHVPDGRSSLTFTNAYEETGEAPGSVTIEGDKAVTGTDIPSGETFTFTLTQWSSGNLSAGQAVDNGVLPTPLTAQVTTDSSGSAKTYPFAFDEITGLADGTYYFKVEETGTGGSGWTSNSPAQIIIVAVSGGEATVVCPVKIADSFVPREQPPYNYRNTSYKVIANFFYLRKDDGTWMTDPQSRDRGFVLRDNNDPTIASDIAAMCAIYHMGAPTSGKNYSQIGPLRDGMASALAFSLAADEARAHFLPGFPTYQTDDLKVGAVLSTLEFQQVFGDILPASDMRARDRLLILEYAIWYLEYYHRAAGGPDPIPNPADYTTVAAWCAAMEEVDDKKDFGSFYESRLSPRGFDYALTEPTLKLLQTVMAMTAASNSATPGQPITALQMHYASTGASSGTLSFSFAGFQPAAGTFLPVLGWEPTAGVIVKDAANNIVASGSMVDWSQNYTFAYTGPAPTFTAALPVLKAGSIRGDLMRPETEAEKYQELLTGYAIFMTSTCELALDGSPNTLAFTNAYEANDVGIVFPAVGGIGSKPYHIGAIALSGILFVCFAGAIARNYRKRRKSGAG